MWYSISSLVTMAIDITIGESAEGEEEE